MKSPRFSQLNIDWNAEPNAPFPEVSAAGSTIELRFLLDSWLGVSDDIKAGRLTFHGCKVWRLGETNEEGWYRGQCRYSKIAPKWGGFFELGGNDILRYQPNDWQAPQATGKGERHYLFYLRDETFECVANEWFFDRMSAQVDAVDVSEVLVAIRGVSYSETNKR
jgi:hypothetical protein